MVGPGVLVTGPGGSGGVSEEAIKTASEHEPVRYYVLRATPGEVNPPVPRQGVPVAKVIEMAEVSFDGGGYLTVPRPNGTVAYLPGEYFREPSTAFENALPAVISPDQGSVRFFRPLLAEEPSGVNAEDNIVTVSGEGLTIGVHGGNAVKVEVSPPSASTSAGSRVQFTAAATGGLEGEGFIFNWTFGDGTTATSVGGEPVSHAFSGSGTYLVRATAVGNRESGGESGPVEVVVGNPPTTEAPGATATPQPPAKNPTGAPGKGREGRGGKGAKPTPSGGGKKRKTNEKDDSSVQRGTSPAGPTRSPEPSEPSSPSTSVVPELPAPLPVPEEPSSTAPEGDVPAESAAPTAHAPAPSRPPTAANELVEGRLVGDDLGPTSIEEAVGGSAEGEGSRSAPGAVGNGGIGAPVGALIVVALLAGGALFEWRRGRPTR